MMSIPTSSGPAEYVTHDLGEATFLAVLNVPLLALRSDGRRVEFVFPGTAAPLAARYWRPGQNSVPARQFHAQLKDLRALVRREVGR